MIFTKDSRPLWRRSSLESLWWRPKIEQPQKYCDETELHIESKHSVCSTAWVCTLPIRSDSWIIWIIQNLWWWILFCEKNFAYFADFSFMWLPTAKFIDQHSQQVILEVLQRSRLDSALIGIAGRFDKRLLIVIGNRKIFQSLSTCSSSLVFDKELFVQQSVSLLGGDFFGGFW